MAVVSFAGMIGVQPELKFVGQNNTPVLNLVIYERTPKDKEDRRWNASLWGKLANDLAHTFNAKDYLAVTGDLDVEIYNDTVQYRVKITHFFYAGKHVPVGAQEASAQTQPQAQPKQANNLTLPPQGEEREEDLPF